MILNRLRSIPKLVVISVLLWTASALSIKAEAAAAAAPLLVAFCTPGPQLVGCVGLGVAAVGVTVIEYGPELYGLLFQREEDHKQFIQEMAETEDLEPFDIGEPTGEPSTDGHSNDTVAGGMEIYGPEDDEDEDEGSHILEGFGSAEQSQTRKRRYRDIMYRLIAPAFEVGYDKVHIFTSDPMDYQKCTDLRKLLERHGIDGVLDYLSIYPDLIKPPTIADFVDIHFAIPGNPPHCQMQN